MNLIAMAVGGVSGWCAGQLAEPVIGFPASLAVIFVVSFLMTFLMLQTLE